MAESESVTVFEAVSRISSQDDEIEHHETQKEEISNQDNEIKFIENNLVNDDDVNFEFIIMIKLM